MTLEISPVDVTDEAALRAWYAVYHAAESYGRDYHTAYAFEEIAAQVRGDHPTRRTTLLLGRESGESVGAASLEWSTVDHLDDLDVHVTVLPDRSGRGTGSAMLAAAEDLARSEGRTRLLAEASYAYAGPPDGTGSHTVEFARARGFTFGLGDVQRVLDLPVDSDLLDRLEGEAADHHAGYSFERYVGPGPDHLLLALGELRASIDTEAPQGEIARAADQVTRESLLADAAEVAAQGRTRYGTIALAPDGSLAGFTDLVVPAHDPGWVYQWGTLVTRPHRGHRLGLALKVRNARWVQESHPDRAAIRTWNAEVNAPMVAVNEAMGFRPVERLGEFQKVLRG